MKTTTATENDVALSIDAHGGGNLIDIIFYNAVNGIAFPSGLNLHINGDGVGIADQTNFVHIGSANLAVSPKEAVQIGLEAAKEITVSVSVNEVISNVPIALQSNPLSIFLQVSYREPFTEYPMWYMFFGPDGSQNVRYGVLVYVWGDNGRGSTYASPKAPSVHPRHCILCRPQPTTLLQHLRPLHLLHLRQH